MIIEYGKVSTGNANRPHGFGVLNPATSTPHPKNPVIGAFFRQIHRADKLGSGMRKMMKYGKSYGGVDPEMIEGDMFRIIVKVPEFRSPDKIAVTPKLQSSGWESVPHSLTEQYTFTDGRVEFHGNKTRRGEQKRSDYILRYNRDFPIAVVEAKPESDPVGTGMQQAKDYAEILGLKFAYATNGHEILEFDYTTGEETLLSSYPSPKELFARLKGSEKISDDDVDTLLAPYHHDSGFSPRYYQQIAINRVVQSVLQGKRRILITMATGTGKTLTAFQICWKLWNSRWNPVGSYRKPRILFLADRNVLIDDPKDKTFTPFGDARYKIEKGEITTSREIYFASIRNMPMRCAVR